MKIAKPLLKLLLTGFLLRLILMLISQSHPDILNHLDWGIRFLSLEPKNFYENIFWGYSWPNQPIGTILLFASIAFIKQIIFNLFLLINTNIPIFPSFIIPILESHLHTWLVKVPFILSDIGLGFLIYKIVNLFRPKLALIASAIFIFNPVIIYNSSIWGQTDSLINLLSLTGLYLLFKKKYFFGIVLFLSSFLFKLSLFIYFPIFIMILFKNIKDWKKFIIPFFTFSLILIMLAIPFSGDKNPIEWLWYMYNGKVFVRQGSMLNGNAFNIWFLLFGVDFSLSEFTKLGPTTYQTISRLIYVTYLLPIFWKFFTSKLNLSILLNTLLLTAFGAFIFMTNMHERYLYPIFPLLTVLIFIQKNNFNLKQLIVLSLIHLINLYNLWFYPLIIPIRNLLLFQNFLFGKFLSLVLIVFFFNYSYKYLRYEISEK